LASLFILGSSLVFTNYIKAFLIRGANTFNSTFSTCL